MIDYEFSEHAYDMLKERNIREVAAGWWRRRGSVRRLSMPIIPIHSMEGG